MTLTLLAEKEMPLLGRKRYTFEWTHQGQATPTKATIKEAVAQHLHLAPEHVALRHIFTNYGSNTSRVIVHTYQDAKLLGFLEPPKGKKAAKTPDAAKK